MWIFNAQSATILSWWATGNFVTVTQVSVQILSKEERNIFAWEVPHWDMHMGKPSNRLPSSPCLPAFCASFKMADIKCLPSPPSLLCSVINHHLWLSKQSAAATTVFGDGDPASAFSSLPESVRLRPGIQYSYRARGKRRERGRGLV